MESAGAGRRAVDGGRWAECEDEYEYEYECGGDLAIAALCATLFSQPHASPSSIVHPPPIDPLIVHPLCPHEVSPCAW